MPFYDLTCSNKHEQLDVFLKVGERPPCPQCGEPTDTFWKRSSSVIQDSIEGGVYIKHGLCNPDGTPRKYYSKSEIDREAKRRGLINRVEHVTDPKAGSDKAKYTTRWV